MPVISLRKLNEFAERYPETKSALKEWYQKMKTGQFQSIAALRTIFPSADKVGKMTVFNIGGNKIRLIAAIHYNRQKIGSSRFCVISLTYIGSINLCVLCVFVVRSTPSLG